MTVTQSRTSVMPDGLRYYLLRGNVMIPLVPVDQLPFQLQGVPRQLSHRQMSDENWKLLQETAIVATPLVIHAPSLLHLQPTIQTHTNSLPPKLVSTPKAHFLAPDHHVRTESASSVIEALRPSRHPLSHHRIERVPNHGRTSPAPGVERYVSLTDSSASIYPKDGQRFGYTKPYPSGIEPDPSKKEFCTHWIKTGECAFTSIGCKYKHEMPMLDKLRDLGFMQVPKWWKEKSAITARGPTWMQHRLASGTGDDKQHIEIPVPRAFPDPSIFRSRQTDEHGLPYGSLQSRSILQEETIVVQAPLSRMDPSPTPMPDAAAQCKSQTPNLLIDFEETPGSPSSPQLSNHSVSSAELCNTQVPSSRSSASLPPTFITIETVSTNREYTESHDIAEAKHNKKEALKYPLIRHESLVSWTSEDEDDTPQVKSLSKHKSTPQRTARRSDGSVKQPGLANSKHATANRNLTALAEPYIKHTTRRVFEPESSGVEVRKSQTGAGGLQRGRFAHSKTGGQKGQPVVIPAAIQPTSV